MSDERPPNRDETRPMPSVPDAEPLPPDATRPIAAVPPLDATRPAAAVPPPPPDATRPFDAVRSDDRDNQIWSGRAEVRPPSPERAEYYERDWADPAPTETPGRWWAPIAVGSAPLVLLALLGFGIAVIVQNSDDETPATTPATTVATTATTRAETTAPTTAPTTTEPTTTEPLEPTPTTTEPASTELTVPALRGMPLADAQAALDRTGLTYRVIRRSSEAEPGTVIDSDPPEGRLVPSDTRITLVVAAEPSAGPTTTTPAGESGED